MNSRDFLLSQNLWGLIDKEISKYSVICAMTRNAQVLWDHVGDRTKPDLDKGVVSRKASRKWCCLSKDLKEEW